MKIVLSILATILLFIGAILTFLPMGTIPILPLAIALLLVLINIYVIKKGSMKFSKILAVIGVILIIIVIAKALLFKDTVVKDQKFEQEKIESQKEDLEDLEELDGL